MASWELAIDVDVPPGEAWALVGDPTSVPRWYPKYVSAEVDGDSRVLRSAEGAELHERLLEGRLTPTRTDALLRMKEILEG